ncbi:MAG: hypothetical protein LLG04_00960 [Parachlamydia sp.]|nr:hypothetical protein [Parachlamydia sp.]
MNMNEFSPIRAERFVPLIPLEQRPIEVPDNFAKSLDLRTLIQKHVVAIRNGNLEPLAKEIAERIEQNQGQLYTMPGVSNQPPYNLNWLATLSMDPYDVMKSDQSAKFCLIIRINPHRMLEIKLLTIDNDKKLSFAKTDGQLTHLNDEEVKKLVERWSTGPNEYAILYSNNRTYYRLNQEERRFPNENKAWKFYHFNPPNFVETLRKAPFHHEAQPEASSGLCGLHALNAFIGCRQFSPQTLGERLTCY